MARAMRSCELVHMNTPAWGAPVLSLRQVVKTYPQPDQQPVTAVGGVSLDLAAGSMTALVGPSGSGKSTLMHCAAGLEPITEGTVVLAGQSLYAMNLTQRSQHRAATAGFIFQDYNLISSLNVVDNIALPARLAGRQLRSEHVADVMARVGLSHRAGLRPSQLSGGERQRVAVARVLATRPAVIFADEPTGALDVANARQVLGWLRAASQQGSAVLLVTHDPMVAAQADSVLVMGAGRLRSGLTGAKPDQIADAIMRAQATS